jgi:hypothetical protein
MTTHRIRNKIGGPAEAHNVNSPEEYRAHARIFLKGLGVPPAEWLRPGGERPAYVSGGWWVVRCDCGNAPSASPEWGLAICLECGYEFAPVFPKDRAEAEAALLARPIDHRHFFPANAAKHLGLAHDGETARGLHRENKAHGATP